MPKRKKTKKKSTKKNTVSNTPSPPINKEETPSILDSSLQDEIDILSKEIKEKIIVDPVVDPIDPDPDPDPVDIVSREDEILLDMVARAIRVEQNVARLGVLFDEKMDALGVTTTNQLTEFKSSIQTLITEGSNLIRSDGVEYRQSLDEYINQLSQQLATQQDEKMVAIRQIWDEREAKYVSNIKTLENNLADMQKQQEVFTNVLPLIERYELENKELNEKLINYNKDKLIESIWASLVTIDNPERVKALLETFEVLKNKLERDTPKKDESGIPSVFTDIAEKLITELPNLANQFTRGQEEGRVVQQQRQQYQAQAQPPQQRQLPPPQPQAQPQAQPPNTVQRPVLPEVNTGSLETLTAPRPISPTMIGGNTSPRPINTINTVQRPKPTPKPKNSAIFDHYDNDNDNNDNDNEDIELEMTESGKGK